MYGESSGSPLLYVEIGSLLIFRHFDCYSKNLEIYQFIFKNTEIFLKF